MIERSTKIRDELPSDLVAPSRIPGKGNRWEGSLPRKPWDYRVTAIVPVLDTPDQLEVCVRLLRAQSQRPYIIVIDTGSDAGNLQRVESLRAADLEVHSIRSHGWRHMSEPVAVACQLGQDLTRTEFCFQTHADCFINSRTLLQDWADLATHHKVVGYQISPRPYAGWESELGHTALMMHMPSIRAAGVRWNMVEFVERFGPAPRNLHLSANRPDTESMMNLSLHEAGIHPLMLGSEENYKRNVNEHFDHPRSFCSSLLFSPDYHDKIAVEMTLAMQQANVRAAEWESAR